MALLFHYHVGHGRRVVRRTDDDRALSGFIASGNQSARLTSTHGLCGLAGFDSHGLLQKQVGFPARAVAYEDFRKLLEVLHEVGMSGIEPDPLDS